MRVNQDVRQMRVPQQFGKESEANCFLFYTEQLSYFMNHPEAELLPGVLAALRLLTRIPSDYCRTKISECQSLLNPKEGKMLSEDEKQNTHHTLENMERIKNDLNSAGKPLSRFLHYQGYNKAGDDLTAYELDAMDSDQMYMAVTDGISALYEILDKNHEWLKAVVNERSRTILQTLATRNASEEPLIAQEEEPALDDKAPFIQHASWLLNRLDRRKDREWILVKISIAVLCRLISENSGAFLLKKIGQANSMENWEDPGVEKYRQKIEQIHGYKYRQDTYYANCAMIAIAHEANQVVDWRWEKQNIEAASEGKLKGAAQRSSWKPYEEMMDNAALLCMIVILEPQPEEIKSFILSRNNRVDELKANYEKLRRNRNRLRLCLCIILAVILMVAGYFAWRFIPRHSVFADYTWADGQPVGIQKLKDEEAGKRVHYAFTTVDGQVTEVQRLNAEGQLANESIDILKSRAARYVIPYGTPTLVTAYDESGNPLTQIEYSGDMAGITFRNPETNQEMYLPLDTRNVDLVDWSQTSSTQIYSDIVSPMYYMHVDERTPEGYAAAVSYRQADEYQSDANGITGMRFYYDGEGRIEQIQYKYGVFSLEYEAVGTKRIEPLAEDRLITRAFVYDAEGNLAQCTDTFMDNRMTVRSFSYDAKGNCIRMQTAADGNIRAAVLMYDEHSRLIERSSVDADGNLLEDEEGCCKTEYTYDEKGRMIRTQRTGKDGTGRGLSWAEYLCTFSADGLSKTEYYYDDNGNPLNTSAGYAVSVTEQKDRAVVTRYYDGDMQPVQRSNGAYAMKRLLDGEGRPLSITWMDADEIPCMTSGGYAGVDYTYIGNMIKTVSYVDEYGNPVNIPEGYCKSEYTYNAKHQVIKEVQTSANNMPKYRWNVRETYYSRQGRIQSQAFFYNGPRDSTAVVNAALGYSVERVSYGEDGHSWIERYYKTDGVTPMINPVKGAAAVQYTMNSQGDIEKIQYLDRDDQPMVSQTDGCVEKEYTYNSMGQIVQLIEKQKVDADLEEAVYKYTYYNETGREASREWRNRERELLINPQEGYACLRWSYVAEPSTVLASYYDEKMQPMENLKTKAAKIVIHYNDAGYYKDWHYENLQGDWAINPEEGYAGYEQTVDARGNILTWRYLDAANQTVFLDSEEMGGMVGSGASDDDFYTGCAMGEAVYDTHGNRIALTKYDTEGIPVLRGKNKTVEQKPEGKTFTLVRYSVPCFRYDQAGNDLRQWGVLSLQYPNVVHSSTAKDKTQPKRAEEKDTGINTGFTTICWEYDLLGNVIRERYMNTDGTAGDDHGTYEIQYIYDANGNVFMEQALDRDGHNVNDLSSMRYVTSLEDQSDLSHFSDPYTGSWGTGDPSDNAAYPQGDAIQFLDESGAPINPFGYGDLTSYFEPEEDETGSIVREKSVTFSRVLDYGANRANVHYDETGHLTWIQFVSEDQTPKYNTVLGYTAAAFEYDEKGRQSKVTFLDENNQPVTHKTLGYATVKKTYTMEGLEASYRFFDPSGKPTVDAELGAYEVRIQYDDANRYSRLSFYGPFGQPDMSKVHKAYQIDYRYNDENKVTELQYLDADGELMNEVGVGWACLQMEYDDLGHIILDAAFDKNKQLCIPFGDTYAKMTRAYDGDEIVSAKYYDEKGKLIDQEWGWAEYRVEKDEHGNVVLEEYLNAEGELVKDEDAGYAQMICEYDQDNQRTFCAYYDSQRKLCIPPDKIYAMYILQIDSDGAETRYYLDDKEHLLSSTYAGSGVTDKIYRNEQGNIREVISVNKQGEETEHSRYSRVVAVYNQDGSISHVNLLNKKGERVKLDNLEVPLEAWEDAEGNIVSWLYQTADFDHSNEQEIVFIQLDFDLNGRIVAERSLNKKRESVDVDLHKERRYLYDLSDRAEAVYFIDRYGERAAVKIENNCIAGIKWYTDTSGNEHTIGYDPLGRPIKNLNVAIQNAADSIYHQAAPWFVFVKHQLNENMNLMTMK